jgi:hypothetical protein
MKNVMESLAGYRDKTDFNVAFEYGKPTSYVGSRNPRTKTTNCATLTWPVSTAT